MAGGLWEINPPRPLEDQHYVPIQPTLKSRRRPNRHDRSTLMQYLQTQSKYEQGIIQQYERKYQKKKTDTKDPMDAGSDHPNSTVQDDGATAVASSLSGLMNGNSGAPAPPPNDPSAAMTTTETNRRTCTNPPSSSSDVGIPTAAAATTATAVSKRIPTSCNYRHVSNDGENGNGSNRAEGDCVTTATKKPNQTDTTTKTVYMDGVFDLFHVGHLHAIRQCKALGPRVVVGVTGDDDAAGYKRPPVVHQRDRVAVLRALAGLVDEVICPCPLVVTEAFMERRGIDLVVHGFASDDDAQKQREFFEVPMRLGKFQRIPYYSQLSTTDIINKIIRTTTGTTERQEAHRQRDPSSERKPSRQNGNGNDPKEGTVASQCQRNANGNTAPSTTTTTSDEGDGPPPPPPPPPPQQQQEHKLTTDTKWFGARISAATKNAVNIPYDPIPLWLRQVMEPHIEKARQNRDKALSTVILQQQQQQQEQVKDDLFVQTNNNILSKFLLLSNRHPSYLTREDDFRFDAHRYPLRETLLRAMSLPDGFDLSRLHERHDLKDHGLYKLVRNYDRHDTMPEGPCGATSPTMAFQNVYGRFVREVCVPRIARLYDEEYAATATASRSSSSPCSDDILCNDNDSHCNEVYYQAFPCLRIVQPDEFSIGPHADIAYGHHPCSINCYVPLTHIDGSSSLFLESRPGSEDWHPIVSQYGGAKQFAGAICMHWTTDNKTTKTRVSLDFRVIPGPLFSALSCDSQGVDVYRSKDGYYNRCSKDKNGLWQKNEGIRFCPDGRNGFPWTVKDWQKFWSKKGKPVPP